MGEEHPLESVSPTERFVLEGLAVLDREDRTPAQTHDLRRTCKERSADSAVVGTPSEAEIMRSLYALESSGVVAEVDPDSRSPVGKGRPFYELAVDPEAVLETER